MRVVRRKTGVCRPLCCPNRPGQDKVPRKVAIQPWFVRSINTWHFTHAAGFQCTRRKHADVHFPHNPPVSPVETTHALSLPGVMAHLLWATFRKKSFHAKPRSQKGWGCRLCTNIRYCRHIYPQMAIVGANKHSPKPPYPAKPTVGYFYTPPQGGASSMPDYPDIFGK